MIGCVTSTATATAATLRPLRMLTYGKFGNLSYLYLPKTTKVVQDFRSGSEQSRKRLIIDVVDGTTS